MARTPKSGTSDLRDEAQEVLLDPPEESGAKVLTEENTAQAEEPGVEYYLFHRVAFYATNGITSSAVNQGAIASKADVLRFLRKADPGQYVLVKVVDELEVETPKDDNIVRSNPRQRKPRKEA